MNFGAGLSGALSGAGLGSSFGPVGSAIGAGIGGLAGLFGSGSAPKMKKYATMSKDQQRLFNDKLNNPLENSPLYQQGATSLRDILNMDPNYTSRLEAPLLRKFEQEIAPGIAERYAAQGTGGGALSSSGFNQAMARGVENLGQDLGAQRASLLQNAINQALSFSQAPYQSALQYAQTPTFAYGMQPAQEGVAPGLFQTAGSIFGPSAGKFFANKFNSPAGAPSSTASFLDQDFRSGAAYSPGYNSLFGGS